MKCTITGNVSRSTSASTVSVKGASNRQPRKLLADNCYSLHGVENDRVSAHTEVVVGTPNIHLILCVGRVRDWELCRQSINVVEVPVRPGTSALTRPTPVSRRLTCPCASSQARSRKTFGTGKIQRPCVTMTRVLLPPLASRLWHPPPSVP